MNECKICGGPLVLLGQLGDLNHYRCRNCGIEVSSAVETVPDEDEEEDGDNA